MGDLTKNFSLRPFTCRNGVWVPSEYMDNVQELARNLQVLRDFLDIPIYVNSGYRTPQYNRSVGGSENSQHLYAKAADIRVTTGMPTECIYDIIEGLIRIGQMKQGGVGLYNTFVHYDIRGTKARWGIKRPRDRKCEVI